MYVRSKSSAEAFDSFSSDFFSLPSSSDGGAMLFFDASVLNCALALPWSSTMRCANCLTSALVAFCAARRPISTSARPPIAASFTNFSSGLAFGDGARSLCPLGVGAGAGAGLPPGLPWSPPAGGLDRLPPCGRSRSCWANAGAPASVSTAVAARTHLNCFLMFSSFTRSRVQGCGRSKRGAQRETGGDVRLSNVRQGERFAPHTTHVYTAVTIPSTPPIHEFDHQQQG